MLLFVTYLPVFELYVCYFMHFHNNLTKVFKDEATWAQLLLCK